MANFSNEYGYQEIQLLKKCEIYIRLRADKIPPVIICHQANCKNMSIYGSICVLPVSCFMTIIHTTTLLPNSSSNLTFYSLLPRIFTLTPRLSGCGSPMKQSRTDSTSRSRKVSCSCSSYLLSNVASTTYNSV